MATVKNTTANLNLDKNTLDRLARQNLERIASGQAMSNVQEQARRAANKK